MWGNSRACSCLLIRCRNRAKNLPTMVKVSDYTLTLYIWDAAYVNFRQGKSQFSVWFFSFTQTQVLGCRRALSGWKYTITFRFSRLVCFILLERHTQDENGLHQKFWVALDSSAPSSQRWYKLWMNEARGKHTRAGGTTWRALEGELLLPKACWCWRCARVSQAWKRSAESH